MPRHTLGDLQHAIMAVLWERGEATAARVHEALREERGLAPTTIATMLRKMEDKGVVAHRAEGLAGNICRQADHALHVVALHQPHRLAGGFTLWPGQPSCEYAKGSGIEHLFDGGLWIGGVKNGVVKDGLTNGVLSHGTESTVAAESIRISGNPDPIEDSVSYNMASDHEGHAAGDICPSCGSSALVYEEGCSKCHACGHSEC